MNLDEVFQEIVSHLDKVDEVREKVLVLNRSAIRSCSEAIKKLHRREDGVDASLEKARACIVDMLAITQENPDLVESYIDSAFQEYVEAITLKTIFAGGELTKPSEMDPPARNPVAYLTGLCDAVGELRRACLDAIRFERFDDAVRYFETMEQIHDCIINLDYPNAIIPDLRHKSDGNRKLIHATRSELTMALHINKLNQNLAREKDS
jgi:translin